MRKIKLTYIIFSIIIIYIFIFSDIGLISRIKLLERMKYNEKKIELLEKQNEIFRLQIEQLKSDREYLAELARKYGYAKPGEKIYKFYEPTANTNQQNTNIQINWLEKISFKDYYLYIILLLVVSLVGFWIYFKKRKMV